MLFPTLFVFVMWVVKISEYVFNTNYYDLGIYPQTFHGLIGIFTAPFIHGDWEHLFSNTFPVLILGTGLFYFYREVSFQVFIYSTFLTGFWVWIGARESYHIGASGVIYALASFLFFGGVFRKNKSLKVISLLVIFLYGSLVWGLFPLKNEISWESHVMGFVAGIILAFNYKNYGPQMPVEILDEEDEEDEETSENTDYLQYNEPENNEYRKFDNLIIL